MTQPDASDISITGDGNVVGDHNTVIVYQGDRPVSVADVLDACRSQVQSMVTEARHKYDPALYVHRAIEQELNQFFDTPLEAGAPNCYLIVAPAGSGKTNLLCHLAGERAGQQPVMLLMGGNLYLSPTAGLLGALQSELQTANSDVNFRSAEDCLHTLSLVVEETGRDALIILDAINEHDKPIEMRKAVEDLLRKTRGRRFKLVVTCRDFYWGVFKGSFWEGATANPLPADIVEDEEGMLGSGDFNRFTVGEKEIALGLYFQRYGISGRPIGDAVEQLRHPLLLRFFCEAYRGQEVGKIESIRLKELFDHYWIQKLASAAERMIKHGDERIQNALLEELGDYLMKIGAYMLCNKVRAIPKDDLSEAVGLTERRGDLRSIYSRIRDEYIILEEHERGQGRRKAVQVAFVYEEFMEYTMARSLLRDWEAAGLDEHGILAAIDALVAQYASFAQVLGVMVYAGLMLREQHGLALWSTLMSRGEPWRSVVLDAIRKLPDSQMDGNAFLVLDEVLDFEDVELMARALDILKTGRFGRRAPKTVMQKVCRLANHRQETIRRRVMLAVRYAPADLKLSVVEQGLRDSLQGVRKNALTSAFELPSELAIPLLLQALHDTSERIRSDAVAGLVRIGMPSVAPLVAALRNSNSRARQEAAAALVRIGAPSVASLVATLRDSEREVRAQAAEALGRLGDTRAVEPLVAVLRDSDRGVRWQAAKKLKQLEAVPETGTDLAWYAVATEDWEGCVRLGSFAVEPLVAVLRDSDRGVRAQAAEALGRLGDTRAVEPLVATLRDSEREVRAQAATALARIGTPPVEQLVATLRHIDSARWWVAEALGRLGDTRAVEPLVAALRDSNSKVRARAAEALGRLGDTRAVEPLVAVLRDCAIVVRAQAAAALGRLGDACALEPLVAALCDNNSGVRVQAVEALASLGDAGAVKPLTTILRDSDSKMRRLAAEALKKLDWTPPSDADHGWYAVAAQDWAGCVRLGSAALEPLLTVLRYGDVGVRRQAAEALGGLSDARAVEPLAAAMNDYDWHVRAAAAGALVQIGNLRAAEALVAALRHGHSDVRQEAAEALGRLGDAGAVEPLMAALHDRYVIVRQKAAEALGRLGDARAVEPLMAALRDGRVTVQAVEALGRLGDARAVEPLMAALRDRDRIVRKEAAEALGQIEDERTVVPLVAALRDRSERVRHSAAAALRRIGTPGALVVLQEYEAAQSRKK